MRSLKRFFFLVIFCGFERVIYLANGGEFLHWIKVTCDDDTIRVYRKIYMNSRNSFIDCLMITCNIFFVHIYNIFIWFVSTRCVHMRWFLVIYGTINDGNFIHVIKCELNSKSKIIREINWKHVSWSKPGGWINLLIKLNCYFWIKWIMNR